MTKAYNEYARKVGLLKEKDKNLEGSDFREGLAAVLSIRVPENLLQFEGQTKGKLGTPLARTVVDNVVGEQMGFYLQENSEMSQSLIRKAIKAREAREAARKAREESRNGKKRKKGESLLSGKLTPAQSRNPKNYILSKETRPVVQQNKDAIGNFKPFYRYEEKSLIRKKRKCKTS